MGKNQLNLTEEVKLFAAKVNDQQNISNQYINTKRKVK